MNLTRVRLARLGALLIVLVLIAIAWFFILAPRLESIDRTQQEVIEAEDRALTLEQRAAQLRKLAGSAPELAADAQAIFAALPRTAAVPAILEQVPSAAERAGISAENISIINVSIPVPIAAPPPAESNASGQEEANAAAATTGIDVGTITVDMTVTGTPIQLQRFLTNVADLDRAVRFTALTVSNAGEGSLRKTMSLQAELFVLRSALPDLVATTESIVAGQGSNQGS